MILSKRVTSDLYFKKDHCMCWEWGTDVESEKSNRSSCSCLSSRNDGVLDKPVVARVKGFLFFGLSNVLNTYCAWDAFHVYCLIHTITLLVPFRDMICPQGPSTEVQV